MVVVVVVGAVVVASPQEVGGRGGEVRDGVISRGKLLGITDASIFAIGKVSQETSNKRRHKTLLFLFA